jgi:hypothetical protein
MSPPSNKDILNDMINTSEWSKKTNKTTADRMELKSFSNNMMGLFRNVQTNQNETIVRENQDKLTCIVEVQTEQIDPSADYEQASNSMAGIFRNVKAIKRKDRK